MTLRITVVISTYESPRALDRVLEGFSLQSRVPDEVVVADDGSGPPTREVVERWQSRGAYRLQHVWQAHQGFQKSKILNKAIAASGGTYLVFSDGDCLPHRHFVADHARLAEPGHWVQGKRAQVREQYAADVQAGDASGWRLLRRGWLWRSAYGLRWPLPIVWRQQRTLRERALGSNMGIWRDDLLAINGYNEAFVGWGSEDREVTVRLYHLGRRKKFVIGRALQFHLDHPATSRSQAQDNGEILARVRAQRLSRCELGLDLHMPSTAVGDVEVPHTSRVAGA